MRPRIDGPSPMAPQGLRDAPAVAELFVDVFRRDVRAFLPQVACEPVPGPTRGWEPGGGPGFRVEADESGRGLDAAMFGARYRVARQDGAPLPPQDRRLVEAIGAVLGLRYHHLFQVASPARLELFRGGSEDHYVAAFVEPGAYAPPAPRPSRVAATIQTLRTAALSTYENHRVSTGALLLGAGDPPRVTPPDALPYGIELTGLKSVHRLCDGERTLFLVDRAGKLAEIVDVARWADRAAGPATDDLEELPCARAFEPHARATRVGGHVCLVLSRNQEIKLFAAGAQAFAFAHGRWRLLDAAAKYAAWRAAVAAPGLARGLFRAALNLAEARRGGLLVVVDEPGAAVGRLVAPHDVLSVAPSAPAEGLPPDLAASDPLARRALHYLARGRDVVGLEPSVLEALASLDGALVADRTGRLLAFGAILRNDPAELPALVAAEGARTTAAFIASRFGPVLKVSEDGVVSCYLKGARAWDL